MNTPDLQQLFTQILCGGTLQDKLAGKDFSVSLLNENTLKLKSDFFLPEKPGRTGRLSTDQEVQGRFPKKSELGQKTSRGRLLHFFANHELLAIETMAYVLLKFPDAPLEFQKGVWGTLQDEQRHMGLYLSKMNEFGVELGDMPLNLYFWKSLASMKSPFDFVTRMSLTFEQANLDFALEYAKLFEKEIDDPGTASLLRQIHDDEVKHVAHGLKWFQKWRSPELSEWEAYSQALPFPLTPRRAKGGRFFSVDSRVQAGFSQNFIDEIQIAGGSRGKVPDYYFFNPECEIEVQKSNLPLQMKQKLHDLSPLMIWIAQEEDVLELPVKPPLEWLKKIYEVKGELPELITNPSQSERYLAFDHLKPWGWGKSAWSKHAFLSSKIRVKAPGTLVQFEQEWFSKSWWKTKLKTEGFVFQQEELFLKWVADEGSFLLQELTAGKREKEFILKSPISTSGRGHLRFPASSLNDPALIAKIVKRIKNEGAVVIEPFLNKKIDFSTQIEINKLGRVKIEEPRFFLVDETFQYQGAFLGNWNYHPRLKPFSICLDENRSKLESALFKIVEILKAGNYTGPVGVDSLIYESENGSIEMEPVIEVNVRYTMGRVALEIERALKKRLGSLQGLWCFTKEELQNESAWNQHEILRTSPKAETNTFAYWGSAAEEKLKSFLF